MTSTVQTEIKTLLDQWCAGVREKNLDAIMAYYDPQTVHEHFSAPFDMASGKALFELQP